MAKKAKKAAKSKSKPKIEKPNQSRPKKAAPKNESQGEAQKRPPGPHLDDHVYRSTWDNRLGALAQKMDKTFEAVVLQALCEFADAWEDHFRTVDVMIEEEERVQIVVKPE